MKNKDYNQPTIFVVDDDEDDLYFIKNAILNTIPNTSVRCFIHGKQLTEFIKENAEILPSFILMDLNMPVCNGKEALQVLNKMNMIGKVPVVIFSTSNNPHDKSLCLQYGASNFISKPSIASVYDDIMQTLKKEYIDQVAINQ